MSSSSDVSLPVLATPPGSGGGVRRGRTERRRFTVLIVIQLLIIAHIVQWLAMGVTLAPVEPSESIQTLRSGVITVGFVFFVLAIASTAIFGRFFCGWGCHVILLQDWCGRLLGRVGIRPKPFRARLLKWIPLLLALYMFVWPVAHRFLVAPWTGGAPEWPGWRWEVTTEHFWETFPGVLMGIPFLLVCGFLTVYLLGMKGYCTYACPYGGVFAPADLVAPVRIRVNDDCEHCGHCTATCSSNVRVHEEVAAFGMVVDPGCMKCLDCVEACPNDALSVGTGRPAISVTSDERAAAVEAGTVRPRFDLGWGEEIALLIVGLLLLLSIRGAYSLPLLFAAGAAACGSWILWKAWRLFTDRNASLHRFALRRSGRLRPAGAVLLVVAACIAIMAVWTGTVNAAAQMAFHHDDRVETPPSVVFSDGGFVKPEASVAAHAEAGLTWYRRAGFLGDGGWSPIPAHRAMIAVRKAWLLSVLGRFDEALAELDGVIERIGLDENLALGRSRLLRVLAPRELDAWYGEVLAIHPTWQLLRDERVTWRLEQMSVTDAIAEARVGVEATPGELLAMRRLAVLLVDHGGPEGWRESAELTERTLEIEPDNPNAWRALALARAKTGDFEAAEVAMRRALEIAATDWRLRHQFAVLLNDRRKWADADRELAEAIRLWELAGGATVGERPVLPERPMGPMGPMPEGN